MNICLKISYMGFNYAGFQRQKNCITIQGILEEKFLILFGKKINIIGCSRTDSGVHALEYYCNFHIDKFDILNINLRDALNSKLSYDIRILDVYEVDEKFNSRYSLKKEYEYKIYNGKVISPFKYLDHLHFKYNLDFEKMRLACKYFEGEHDFVGFMSKGSSVKNTVRTVFNSNIYKEGDFIFYNIIGSGFLYNMVRIIVGTLLMVGQSKINYFDIPNIINSRNRKNAGFVAQAKGLCLKKVFYE